MGQTARTSKLLLDLSATRRRGGVNTHKQAQTVETDAHPRPDPEWNFSHAFPDFPNRYRRSVIKDCIGKARGYLTTLQKWQATGQTKGKPGKPTASNHPTLYAGTFTLELDELDLRKSFVRRKRVYWLAVGMAPLSHPLQPLF